MKGRIADDGARGTVRAMPVPCFTKPTEGTNRMKSNRTRSLRSAALAAAIVLAAGSTSAVLADAKGGGGLVTARNPGGRTTISLTGGIPIRTTGAAVSRQRLISFTGSPTLVAVWDEVTAQG